MVDVNVYLKWVQEMIGREELGNQGTTEVEKF